MILSNIKDIDYSEIFFCNYSESGSMDQMLCKEFYSQLTHNVYVTFARGPKMVRSDLTF